jgi:hypothetical protein
MVKILDIIGSTLSKYGLFPAVSILALIIGGYGCYQAHDNQRTIQQQALDIARLEARLDASTKELSDRMGGVEKSLVELTTQIKLLVDGKLILSK